ncbi:MAG: OmpA family protein [Xanthomonadales bacterium]|nr:OmpA family protein [Xanthomonadales bacterium]
MNLSAIRKALHLKLFAAAAIASLLLTACVSTPQSPPGSAEVRAKLTQLQSDTDLASRAPLEIKEAEAAVRLAEVPVPKDKELGTYRVYLADHSVDIATAKATTRYTEDQRVLLSEQREAARLAARTREADMARREADMARNETNRALNESDRARAEADLARDETNRALNESDRARDEAEAARLAEQKAIADAAEDRGLAADAAAKASLEAAELQRQIALLQAEATDRGIVLTLGNVLFATGRAELKSGATDALNKLVTFLNQYPDRDVEIEGHTDNVGSDTSNQSLSERRAESVKSYLLQQGIGTQRLSSTGKGEGQPIGDNNTETGRQQNRRVEIIIENPPVVAGG